MRIVINPAPGAVGALRLSIPGLALSGRGHRVLMVGEAAGAGFTPDQERAMVATADVVALHIASGIRPWEERDRSLKQMRGALVGEIDDDEWAWASDPASREPAAAHLMEGRGSPEALANVESWLRNVDLVTTTTDTLAAVLRAHGAREVAVCPNALVSTMGRSRPRTALLAATDLSPAKAMLARGKRDKTPRYARPSPHQRRIGWTGSIAHKADLGPALTAIRNVASVDGTVEVRSLGPVDFRRTAEWKDWACAYDRVLALHDEEAGSLHVVTESALAHVETPGVAYDTVPFAAYYHALEVMCPDVAVIPMRPSAFNASKSDCTLLSWAIQGVPAVCSRVGPYAEAERDGFPAVYVDHDDARAWTDALRSLLYEPIRAAELGERARAWALARRTHPRAAEAWERAYTRAAEIAATRGGVSA